MSPQVAPTVGYEPPTAANNAPAAAGYYQSPSHLNNAARQFDLDIALWYGALAFPASPAEGDFLKRLFGVLYQEPLPRRGASRL